MDPQQSQDHEASGYGDMLTDGDMSGGPVPEHAAGGEAAQESIDSMRKRLKEIEDEAGALREMQAKVEKEMGAVQGHVVFYCSPLPQSSQLTVDVDRESL
ncbi:hypothetical protein Taro_012720 [Colocasia esculenta]|uniref:Uncharacterized protein n=1 Tax=Colocasia esculenta TaxID=4460 RepID=A0A843U9W7_COLES|nr:hypothetical protein [Colocasia esculenta]